MKRVLMALTAASILGIAAPAGAAPNFPEQPTENAPYGTQTACDANLQQGIHGRGHASEQGVANQIALFSDACFGL